VLPVEGEGLGAIDVDADEVGLGGIDANCLGVVHHRDLVSGVALVLPALASDGCLVAVAGDEAAPFEEGELVFPPVAGTPQG